MLRLKIEICSDPWHIKSYCDREHVSDLFYHILLFLDEIRIMPYVPSCLVLPSIHSVYTTSGHCFMLEYGGEVEMFLPQPQ